MTIPLWSSLRELVRIARAFRSEGMLIRGGSIQTSTWMNTIGIMKKTQSAATAAETARPAARIWKCERRPTFGQKTSEGAHAAPTRLGVGQHTGRIGRGQQKNTQRRCGASLLLL